MDGELRHIDKNELYHKLQIFKSLVKENTIVLQFIIYAKELNGSFPKITISLRIVPTITSVSAEK